MWSFKPKITNDWYTTYGYNKWHTQRGRPRVYVEREHELEYSFCWVGGYGPITMSRVYGPFTASTSKQAIEVTKTWLRLNGM